MLRRPKLVRGTTLLVRGTTLLVRRMLVPSTSLYMSWWRHVLRARGLGRHLGGQIVRHVLSTLLVGRRKVSEHAADGISCRHTPTILCVALHCATQILHSWDNITHEFAS